MGQNIWRSGRYVLPCANGTDYFKRISHNSYDLDLE